MRCVLLRVVMAEAEFLYGSAARRRARPPAARRGRGLRVLRNGCGACMRPRHRGEGSIGPDLTHVVSRHYARRRTAFPPTRPLRPLDQRRQHVKPENLMPPYGIFTDAELTSLALYLDHLD